MKLYIHVQFNFNLTFPFQLPIQLREVYSTPTI